MTDLIEIKKIDGKVVVVNTILKNQKNDYVVDYARKNYAATMDYKSYGFDNPILGIIGKDMAYPIDNSDRYFGRGEEGLVMICPNKEEMELEGFEDLFILYDEEGFVEEVINF